MRWAVISILLASIASSPLLGAPAPGVRGDTDRTQREHSSHQHSAQSAKQLSPQASRTGPSARRAGPDTNPHIAVPRAPQIKRVEQRVPGATIDERRHVERVPNRPIESAAGVLKPQSQPHERVLPTTRSVRHSFPRQPVVSTMPRRGTEPPINTRPRPTPTPRWNTNWRKDSRYDWTKWRRHNRTRFHLGFYIDPFGWGYFPYSVGWRLWPHYYARSYWIADPWYYHLPPAPAGTRWVRYYNDALLVDVWTGRVIDVIHGFFW